MDTQILLPHATCWHERAALAAPTTLLIFFLLDPLSSLLAKMSTEKHPPALGIGVTVTATTTLGWGLLPCLSFRRARVATSEFSLALLNQTK